MPPKQVVKRKSSDTGGVAPRALSVLSSNFSGPMYHQEQGLRPPFGIYAVSIANVIAAFEDVLPLLQQAHEVDLRSKERAVGWDNDLLKAMQTLLYSLMEHFDDCESILKGFLEPGTKHSEVDEVKNYERGISKYREHIGKVVNHIKHKQGRLRSIALYGPDDFHLGYFVEGPDAEGSLGPAPHIHMNGATAFSYSRDLRLHFHGLYYISEQLSQSIGEIVGFDESSRAIQLDSDSRYLDLGRRISQLPMVVFPNELNIEFPSISIDESEPQFFHLETSLKRRPRGLGDIRSPFQVVTFYQTDGVTRAYRMPYRR